ncbi:MAG: Cysteine--tRNA ligase [candidate division BRC1 bacterium ADurb.BinA364]|nr:MAG: Cysteine--tRNA ligase [candidate division BRC1 bacterium ADurb.BinA364]
MNPSFYNTLTRKIEPFEPLASGKAGMYCCGPTVYNFAHIGNLRTYVFEDILRRTLEMAGYKVKHVMNITDVGHLTGDDDEGEDKMLVAMRREGKSAREIADFYAEAFLGDCAKLNIRRPHVICRATEHIGDMIDWIRRLEESGLAYAADGNVYFSIDGFPAYGRLAGQNLEDLQAGARIAVDSAKRNPLDFALWFTNSKFENQEMTWESPWGRGYPGWHIECSAMSVKYLGEQFDIHCGGVEHIPVHHTNEIAQTEAATGRSPWVRYWIHAEWLMWGKEKMSKSLGNYAILATLEEKGYDPLAFRYLCLGASYRQKLGFTYEALDAAATALERLRRAVAALREAGRPSLIAADHPRLAEFQEALCDDLNVSRALSVVWAVLKSEAPEAEQLGLLYEFDKVLGLGLKDYAPKQETAPGEVLALVSRRADARRARDFAEADRLRDAIQALGWAVKDTPEGAEVSRM